MQCDQKLGIPAEICSSFWTARGAPVVMCERTWQQKTFQTLRPSVRESLGRRGSTRLRSLAASRTLEAVFRIVPYCVAALEALR